MISGMLEDILTPPKILSSYASAHWDKRKKQVVVSWFGTDYSITINDLHVAWKTDEDLNNILLQWVLERIPVQQNEKDHFPSYCFWDPTHQKYCAAVARSNSLSTHHCIPGALPSASELPFLITPRIQDFTASTKGSVLCLESKKFLPAAALSLKEEELNKLVGMMFPSILNLYGLLLPQTLCFGTEEAMKRYVDTDITGDAILITPDRIRNILMKKGL